jgi:vesicle coat complex subunit
MVFSIIFVARVKFDPVVGFDTIHKQVQNLQQIRILTETIHYVKKRINYEFVHSFSSQVSL